MARPRIGATLSSAALVGALIAACTAAVTPGPTAVPGASLATGAPSGSIASSPSGSSGGSPTGTDGGGRPSIPAVSLPFGSPGTVTLPAAVLDPILADASTRSGVPRADLVVVSAASRTWPDGSLGCPAPGVAYIQVVLEGYQVIVRAGTTLYDYRGAGTTIFRLCKAIPG